MKTLDLYEMGLDWQIVCKGCKHEDESFGEEPCKSCEVDIKTIRPSKYEEAQKLE